MKDLLRLSGLAKRYPPGRRVFSEVNGRLQEGEFVWLTGRSGSGKSTLLRLIAGIERPTHGHIHVNGRDIGQLGRSQMPYYRQHLGLIFQDPMLLMDRDVFANVALNLQIRGMDQATIRSRVGKALQRVGLAGRESAHPAHLSGGEAARVSIARALVAGPKLVLADEPTGNLDQELALDILDLFRQLHERGVSLIVASHDRQLIARYPGSCWALQDERLLIDAEPPAPA